MGEKEPLPETDLKQTTRYFWASEPMFRVPKRIRKANGSSDVPEQCHRPNEGSSSFIEDWG